MPKANTLTRLASALTYPLRLDDFLAVIDPRHSSRQLRAVVTKVTPAAPGVATLTLRPGRGWLPHKAGQWMRVGVDVGGVRQWRPFTISSPEGEAPSITVGAAGDVSTKLVNDTRPGDVVFIDQPEGDFLLPAPLTTPLLLVAGGTGATPMYALISTLLARLPDADVVLLQASRTPQDAIFAAEFAALASRHEGLKVIHWHSRESGRLKLAASIDTLVPDWRDRAAYVCGPTSLIADAEAFWSDARLPLTVERFTIPRIVDPDAVGGTVTFARSGQTLDAPGASSLLEVGERAGIELPSGCRMGICRTCLKTLNDGQVRDLVTGSLNGEPGEHIRTCVSAAAGDVTLDA